MAVALSQLGRSCAWAGALPRSPMGRLVAGRLRAAAVNLDGVVWSEAGRVDWDHLMSSRILHLTGITPAPLRKY